MHITEFVKHVGNIVLLDLISGMQVCTEIKSLDHDLGKINTGKVVVFQIAVEPVDPSQPPGPNNPMQQKVNAQPYGGPFTLPHTECAYDVAHIIQVWVPVAGIEKGYLQATSGIEIAGAASLGGPSGLVV
jgi:hypothetical protein